MVKGYEEGEIIINEKYLHAYILLEKRAYEEGEAKAIFEILPKGKLRK